MKPSSFLKSDLFILILLAAAKFILHLLTNSQYGFHRDELATLHDARNLAWGFIAYPPLTPFLGSIELKLFGTSLVGFRFFSALSQSIVMVVAGLMAKELGGSRKAQIFGARERHWYIDLDSRRALSIRCIRFSVGGAAGLLHHPPAEIR